MLYLASRVLLQKPRFAVKHIATGMILISLMTVLMLCLANQPTIATWGLGSLTLAILGGMVLGNTVYPRLHPRCDAGVQWAKHHLLRWGIILYGFKLSFQQITSIGATGITIDILTLTSTFLLACWIGQRWFKLDQQTVLLIGAGSSICGAAAVLATAPVLKGPADKIAVAVSTVVIFGTTAMFLYPWIYHFILHYSGSLFTPQTFGIYLGSTVHEVAQVVAAGHAISPETENVAVIGKMLRVMMLAPFLLILSFWLKQKQSVTESTEKAAPLIFPWFALGFILMAAFNSFALLPTSWVKGIVHLDNILLTMAMVALGIATRFNAVKQAGLKPILLALLLFIWLIFGGAAINLGIEHLFAA
ncbi:YeiH family protein [Pectobacteriaceae bacterium CE90]|nr:YeiH family protein [Pectobacteriaceae bacterium CE90]